MNTRCTAEPATLDQIARAHAEVAALFDKEKDEAKRDRYRIQLAALSSAYLQHPDFRRGARR